MFLPWACCKLRGNRSKVIYIYVRTSIPFRIILPPRFCLANQQESIAYEISCFFRYHKQRRLFLMTLWFFVGFIVGLVSDSYRPYENKYDRIVWVFIGSSVCELIEIVEITHRGLKNIFGKTAAGRSWIWRLLQIAFSICRTAINYLVIVYVVQLIDSISANDCHLLWPPKTTILEARPDHCHCLYAKVTQPLVLARIHFLPLTSIKTKTKLNR